MQASLPIFDPHRSVLDVQSQLERRLTIEAPHEPRSAIEEVVYQIVLAAAEPALARLALSGLRAQVKRWTDLADLPREHFAEILQPLEQAEPVRRDLQAAMRIIRQQGALGRLDFLANLPVRHALAWLERLPGLGRSGASFVLGASALARPVLLIDDGYQRVMQRLGFLAPGAGLETAHLTLSALMPAEWQADAYRRHYAALSTLAQRHCRTAVPRCRRCPLRGVCLSARV